MKTAHLISKVTVGCAMGILLALAFACGHKEEPKSKNAAPQPSASPSGTPSLTQVVNPSESKLLEQEARFDHTKKEHKQQNCELCHLRANNDPNPVLPGHSACIACHGQDFTSTTSKLCIVCHQTPLAAQPKVLPFATQLIQFGMKEFSHKIHLDQGKMPAGTTVPKCDACHKFDSARLVASYQGHPECYSCHTHQFGEKLATCETCHAPKDGAMTMAQGPGTAYSLYRFTHGNHFKQATVGQSCDKCHHPLLQAVANKPDESQINTARGQRHSSGCWNCHVKAKEPLCTKCHVGGPPAL